MSEATTSRPVRRPALDPHRGDRRRRHERDRHRARGDGSPGVGQRSQGVELPRPAAGRWVSTSASVTTPRTSAPPMWSRRPRRSRRRTPRSAAALARGIPVLRRAEILAAHRGDEAGGRRRGHARQDDDVVDARARPRGGVTASVVHRRRRAQRDRHRRGVGRRAASCSSSRPTRATARSSSCRLTRCSSRTSSPTTSSTTASYAALRDAFHQFVAQARGPRVVCVDDPHAAVLADELGALGYGTARAARTTAWSTSRPAAAASAFTLRTPSGRDVRRLVAGARRAQRPERRGSDGDGARARRGRARPWSGRSAATAVSLVGSSCAARPAA